MIKYSPQILCNKIFSSDTLQWNIFLRYSAIEYFPQILCNKIFSSDTLQAAQLPAPTIEALRGAWEVILSAYNVDFNIINIINILSANNIYFNIINIINILRTNNVNSNHFNIINAFSINNVNINNFNITITNISLSLLACICVFMNILSPPYPQSMFSFLPS